MINTGSILVQIRPAKMLIYNHICHYMVVSINKLQTFMLLSDSDIINVSTRSWSWFTIYHGC